LRGRKASAETKRKQSAAQSGERNGFYNKTHSPDARNKMRIAKLGRSTPLETRKKMSEAHKARPPKSEECRQKLREAALRQHAERRAAANAGQD
jgi:NUMOD3 motif